MNEAQIQYGYIEKAKQIISEKAREKGGSLTCCVQTFGCQMPPTSEIRKTA